MRYQLSVLVTGLLLSNAVSAATPIDLHHQPAAYLQRHIAAKRSITAGNFGDLKQVRTDVDFNQTAHTRIQQVYAGVPVWDAAAVVHTPKVGASAARNGLASINNTSTMNGIIYEGLEKDLANTPAYALTATQQAKAMQEAKAAYAKKSGNSFARYSKETTKTIVFIDEDKQAHYAYLISFYLDDGRTGAHRPTSIVDAVSLKAYRTWDQVFTADLADTNEVKSAIAKLKSRLAGDEEPMPELYDVDAGGIGGNVKEGEVIYDGVAPNADAMKVKAVDVEVETMPGIKQKVTLCTLSDDSIAVVDVSYDNGMIVSLCAKDANLHNGVAWLSRDNNFTRWNDDEMNGGYSPSIDAFSEAVVVRNVYQDWYNIPALINEDGTPMTMIMRVHYGRNFDNAFWNGEVMTFGDGGKMFYPLTSLGVTMHEISHGFTSQHSNIDSSNPQMGALHESFSDMAAVAANYYQNKVTSWEIGREIMKGEGALRYLDNPTKDGRSVDNMKDYSDAEVHAGAGIFNKAFYLIGTSKGWDVQKAFNIMVKANMNYWNASMVTMADAACGVVAATKDYGYNISDVRVAFAKVGIDTDACEVH